MQLLPIKQTVRYFCFDNPITEEIVDINESAAKKINFALEDDHFLNVHLHLLHPGFLLNSTSFGFYIAILKSSHPGDIETPPPNNVIG